MGTASGTNTAKVSEFAEPINMIYGRSNSDRASYGNAARSEDIHPIRYLWKHAKFHPMEFFDLV